MKEFIFPMKKREKIAGWIYLPIHCFLMSLIILPIIVQFIENRGQTVDPVTINAIYYVIGIVYVLIFMFSYLRENFTSTWRRGPFPTVLIAFGLMFAANIVVNVALASSGIDLVNPNQEAVNESTVQNFTAMFAIAVIMGPIVEEVLFRGVVFGNIRMKNRILAYVVSVLLFAVYHLWASAILYQDWTILIYMLQYIPTAIMLAWTYERCGSIWASILLHSIMNALSLLVNMAIS